MISVSSIEDRLDVMESAEQRIGSGGSVYDCFGMTQSLFL